MIATRTLFVALLGLVGLSIASPVPADATAAAEAATSDDNSKVAIPDLKENSYYGGGYGYPGCKS